MRFLPGIAVALVAAAALAAPAFAHVQVRPAEVAPDDPVLWTVMVPNEQRARTTSVEVQVPDGVTPFSYAEVPGWKRELVLAPDKSVGSIKWTGSLPSDGLGVFTFLASSPTGEGEIAWKAIQTYSNGDVVRWIGGPDSGEPASVTTVSSDVASQSAGGSHAGHDAGEPEGGDAPAGAADSGSSGSDDGSTATVISIVALVAALAALGLAFATRRRG